MTDNNFTCHMCGQPSEQFGPWAKEDGLCRKCATGDRRSTMGAWLIVGAFCAVFWGCLLAWFIG